MRGLGAAQGQEAPVWRERAGEGGTRGSVERELREEGCEVCFMTEGKDHGGANIRDGLGLKRCWLAPYVHPGGQKKVSVVVRVLGTSKLVAEA